MSEARARDRGTLRWILAFCALALIAGGLLYWRAWLERDRLPVLPIADLDSERRAAKVDLLKGTARARTAQAADFREGKYLPAASQAEWTPLSVGAALYLGMLVEVPAGSEVHLTTAGNYLVALKGGNAPGGQFILEDARTDEPRSRHTLFWRVKGGSFRIKAHDYDPSAQLYQVQTPVARIVVDEGEVGMSVQEAAGGQFWLVSGKAKLLWNDGRRKELTVKGIEPL